MPSRLPRIISPSVRLLTVDGREVVLLTVELWPGHVRLRLAAVQDSHTDRLDAEHEARMHEWAQRAAGRSDEDFPEMPGSEFFRHIRFSVRDDVGTPYALEGGATAGSGSEWEAMWQFRPGIPDGLNEIEVMAKTAGDEHSVLLLIV